MRVPVLVAVVSCLLVSGCAATAPADPGPGGRDPAGASPSTASPSPTPASPSPTRASPSSTPSPTAQPFIAPTQVSATRWACEALLDAATIDRFAAAGYDFSEDFGDRMVAQGQRVGLFVEYGGVVCQWGVPDTGDSVVHGQSPISEAAASAVVAGLVDEGYTRETALGGDLYCLVGDEEGARESCFLFEGGHWFTAPRGLIGIVQTRAGLESK